MEKPIIPQCTEELLDFKPDSVTSYFAKWLKLEDLEIRLQISALDKVSLTDWLNDALDSFKNFHFKDGIVYILFLNNCLPEYLYRSVATFLNHENRNNLRNENGSFYFIEKEFIIDFIDIDIKILKNKKETIICRYPAGDFGYVITLDEFNKLKNDLLSSMEDIKKWEIEK